MSASEPPQAPPILATGRGSSLELPNRFDRIGREIEWDQLADDPEFLAERARPATQFFADQSQSIVSENDSPDIPFRYSVNPYRGCEHGCAYCKPYPFSASCGSASVYPCRDDRNYFQRLGFRLNRGVRR